MVAVDPSQEHTHDVLVGAETGTGFQVAESTPEGARRLVVEDTRHACETACAALPHYSRLVPEDGFFVIEDGVVDDPGPCVGIRPPGEAGGVVPAVRDWHPGSRESAFERRTALIRYGIYRRDVRPRRTAEAVSAPGT
ncbi:hypothetical protein OHB00_44415 [Streptomyces sp. NBC_00631]|uniref:hypothetical protein n=1 Tax=Streptomyces sp. NBC_00631 TaxID=2975793 RepID=UPI0030E12F28